jgi:hypothetical protein
MEPGQGKPFSLALTLRICLVRLEIGYDLNLIVWRQTKPKPKLHEGESWRAKRPRSVTEWTKRNVHSLC